MHTACQFPRNAGKWFGRTAQDGWEMGGQFDGIRARINELKHALVAPTSRELHKVEWETFDERRKKRMNRDLFAIDDVVDR